MACVAKSKFEPPGNCLDFTAKEIPHQKIQYYTYYTAVGICLKAKNSRGHNGSELGEK